MLIPPSKIFISVAKNYGWTEENIIKINLPRWDKYNNLDEKKKTNHFNNSIFIMFTWRQIVANNTISNDYFKNILNLINNKLLIHLFLL